MAHDSSQCLFLGEARLDAILIHGVDNMSTKDVFAYFSDFVPGSVEWIDDTSCKSHLYASVIANNFLNNHKWHAPVFILPIL